MKKMLCWFFFECLYEVVCVCVCDFGSSSKEERGHWACLTDTQCRNRCFNILHCIIYRESCSNHCTITIFTVKTVPLHKENKIEDRSKKETYHHQDYWCKCWSVLWQIGFLNREVEQQQLKQESRRSVECVSFTTHRTKRSKNLSKLDVLLHE